MKIPDITAWIVLACEGKTLSRGVRLAAVVGTILVLINYGDMLLAGNRPPVVKVLLTYCVPFLVSVWTSVAKDIGSQHIASTHHYRGIHDKSK